MPETLRRSERMTTNRTKKVDLGPDLRAARSLAPCQGMELAGDDGDMQCMCSACMRVRPLVPPRRQWPDGHRCGQNEALMQAIHTSMTITANTPCVHCVSARITVLHMHRLKRAAEPYPERQGEYISSPRCDRTGKWPSTNSTDRGRQNLV